MWIGPSSEKNDFKRQLILYGGQFSLSTHLIKPNHLALSWFASKYQQSTMPNEYSEEYGYFYLTL